VKEALLAKIVDRLMRCPGIDSANVAAMARHVLDVDAYGLDDDGDPTPVSPKAIAQLRTQGIPQAFFETLARDAAAKQLTPAARTAVQLQGQGYESMDAALVGGNSTDLASDVQTLQDRGQAFPRLV
jgi:hypothetical protein